MASLVFTLLARLRPWAPLALRAFGFCAWLGIPVDPAWAGRWIAKHGMRISLDG